MTTYNTYQEAKIANPDCDIAEITEKAILEFGEKHVFEALVKSSDWESGYAFVDNFNESPRIKDGYWKLCYPADHCMTVEKFLADGHKFVEGDLILDEGVTWTVSDKVNSDTYIYTVKSSNKPDIDDSQRYILRAAALENQMNIDKVETQTEHQEAMSAFSGEVEWRNGDKCMFVGEEYTFGCINPICDQGSVVIFDETGDYHGCFIGELSKPETPQQREDRERLEAAYDLYISCNSESGVNKIFASYDWFINSKIAVDYWLAIVDKTNYRVGMK